LTVNKKLVLVILLIIALTISCLFLYALYFRGRFFDDAIKVGFTASYNKTENSVLVNATSWVNQTDVFNRAVVKDQGGQTLATSNFGSMTLHPFGSINLKIDMGDVDLASGQSYKIELYTIDGKTYHSVLTLYEKVKTTVTLIDAHTLQVDVKSFANQTIVFNQATINYWNFNHTKDGHNSVHPNDLNTPLSSAKLQPNGSLSFTLPYKQGFTPGNYTLFLYSSTPDSQYVEGAYAFFAVTGQEDCFKGEVPIGKAAFFNVSGGNAAVWAPLTVSPT
jgi:hypothetical protein